MKQKFPYLTLAFGLFFSSLVLSSAQLQAQVQPQAQTHRTKKQQPVSTEGPRSVDAALIELEKQFFAAIREKDNDKLNGILADDFAYVVPGQPEMTRVQFLKHVHGLPEPIEWLGADDMRVRILGNIAVVTGVRNMKTRTDAGALTSSDTGFADLFRKNGDEWELVLVHALEMPAQVNSQVGKQNH